MQATRIIMHTLCEVERRAPCAKTLNNLWISAFYAPLPVTPYTLQREAVNFNRTGGALWRAGRVTWRVMGVIGV